ncbi:MAG: NADH-quinone oxidoreductase subunit A [Acidimicrobiales bacterium]
MEQYLPVLVLLVLATLFGALTFVASGILAPRRTTAEKVAPYECGITPGRDLPERFPVRFYLVAMLFVIFDIEIVFLYPWAITHQGAGVFGLLGILLFSALLFESFVYLIAKGALEWGPLQVSRRLDPMRSAERTTSATIRRVGTDGRINVEAAPDPSSPRPDREEVAA